jgi:hypothetical protein
MMIPHAKDLPTGVSVDRLVEVCRRWRITELALFGSYARGEAGQASDVDLLVTYAPDALWSLFDHAGAQGDLSEVFGRPVDLVSRRAIESSENWIRRRAILDSARVLYAA